MYFHSSLNDIHLGSSNTSNVIHQLLINRATCEVLSHGFPFLIPKLLHIRTRNFNIFPATNVAIQTRLSGPCIISHHLLSFSRVSRFSQPRHKLTALRPLNKRLTARPQASKMRPTFIPEINLYKHSAPHALDAYHIVLWLTCIILYISVLPKNYFDHATTVGGSDLVWLQRSFLK
jgi:hypothetical protein